MPALAAGAHAICADGFGRKDAVVQYLAIALRDGVDG
jgi:hypothetical protein